MEVQKKNFSSEIDTECLNTPTQSEKSYNTNFDSFEESDYFEDSDSYEDYYNNNYVEVIKIVNRIISDIPCPLCKEHAINRMKRVKVSDLNTKDKLKIFFYEFHNEVNKQNGQKVENISILENYKSYNMTTAYINFINIFFKSYYAGSGLGTAHLRNKNKKKIKKYFNNNWNILFN